MAQPYNYNYKYNSSSRGSGLLDYTSNRVSQKQSIEEAKGLLGGYDAGGEYDKMADKKLFIIEGGGGKHNNRAGTVTGLSFTNDQLQGVLPSLQNTYGETHGGINTRKVDTKLARNVLNVVNSGGLQSVINNKSYNEKYDSRSQIGALYAASIVGNERMRYTVSDFSGESFTFNPDPSDVQGKKGEMVFVEDKDKTLANFKKNLQMMADTDKDSYFTYLAPHGERGSDRAYGQIQGQLLSASKDARKNYIDTSQAELDNEMAKIQMIEKENADRVARRNATYAKLFNVNTNKRYL